MEPGFETSLFVIFLGAALLATVALYARQAMIVAYIVLGVLIGPWGLGLVTDSTLIGSISNVGIIFLLYLMGLDLLPQQLWAMLGKALATTLASSLVFFLSGWAIAGAFGFPTGEAALIGAALMFSSTIIGVKLVPTTTLHHRHTGQMIVSVLLLQDLLAIIVLLVLQGAGKGGDPAVEVLWQLGALPVLLGAAWLLERFVLVKLIARFDQIHEYIFLLAIAWCLGVAELAAVFGLSHEIGAFVAGVTLASSPIALFITEKLKPLRDFFLIIFFFSLGASFDPGSTMGTMLPALVLALLAVALKPLVFRHLFFHAGAKRSTSSEVGFRLGQMSEFSLLIAILALDSGVIGQQAAHVIQTATLLTFVVSSFIIVRWFPTPIGMSERLRRD